MEGADVDLVFHVFFKRGLAILLCVAWLGRFRKRQATARKPGNRPVSYFHQHPVSQGWWGRRVMKGGDSWPIRLEEQGYGSFHCAGRQLLVPPLVELMCPDRVKDKLRRGRHARRLEMH